VNKEDWTLWPEGAPRLGAMYMTCGATMDETEMAAKFEDRYGQPPEFVFVADDNRLRLGPVPERVEEWVENS